MVRNCINDSRCSQMKKKTGMISTPCLKVVYPLCTQEQHAVSSFMQTKQEGQCLSELIVKTSKTIDLEFRDTQIGVKTIHAPLICNYGLFVINNGAAISSVCMVGGGGGGGGGGGRCLPALWRPGPPPPPYIYTYTHAHTHTHTHTHTQNTHTNTHTHTHNPSVNYNKRVHTA